MYTRVEMKMLKHVNEENFEQEVLNEQGVILVDFFAEWCGPCQMLGPVLERIAEEGAKFDIAKVDIDKAQELAIKYGVEVVPTMIIFKNGQKVGRMEGLRSASEIKEEIAKYVEE